MNDSLPTEDATQPADEFQGQEPDLEEEDNEAKDKRKMRERRFIFETFERVRRALDLIVFLCHLMERVLSP